MNDRLKELKAKGVVDFHCRWLEKLRSLVLSLVQVRKPPFLPPTHEDTQGIEDWTPPILDNAESSPSFNAGGYDKNELSLLSTSAKTGILYRAQRARSRVLITQKAPSTQARDRYHEALQIVKQCQEHLEQASKDHRFETSGIVSQRMNLKEIRRMLGISPLKDLMDPQAEKCPGKFFSRLVLAEVLSKIADLDADSALGGAISREVVKALKSKVDNIVKSRKANAVSFQVSPSESDEVKGLLRNMHEALDNRTSDIDAALKTMENELDSNKANLMESENNFNQSMTPEADDAAESYSKSKDTEADEDSNLDNKGFDSQVLKKAVDRFIRSCKSLMLEYANGCHDGAAGAIMEWSLHELAEIEQSLQKDPGTSQKRKILKAGKEALGEGITTSCYGFGKIAKQNGNRMLGLVLEGAAATRTSQHVASERSRIHKDWLCKKGILKKPSVTPQAPPPIDATNRSLMSLVLELSGSYQKEDGSRRHALQRHTDEQELERQDKEIVAEREKIFTDFFPAGSKTVERTDGLTLTDWVPETLTEVMQPDQNAMLRASMLCVSSQFISEALERKPTKRMASVSSQKSTDLSVSHVGLGDLNESVREEGLVKTRNTKRLVPPKLYDFGHTSSSFHRTGWVMPPASNGALDGEAHVWEVYKGLIGRGEPRGGGCHKWPRDIEIPSDEGTLSITRPIVKVEGQNFRVRLEKEKLDDVFDRFSALPNDGRAVSLTELLVSGDVLEPVELQRQQPANPPHRSTTKSPTRTSCDSLCNFSPTSTQHQSFINIPTSQTQPTSSANDGVYGSSKLTRADISSDSDDSEYERVHTSKQAREDLNYRRALERETGEEEQGMAWRGNAQEEYGKREDEMGGKHISRFCSSGEMDRGEGGESNSASAHADADKKQLGLPNRRAAISSESLERIRCEERTGQDGDQQPPKCLPRREKRGGDEGEGREANGCDGRAPNFYLEVLPCANRSVLKDTTRGGGGGGSSRCWRPVSAPPKYSLDESLSTSYILGSLNEVREETLFRRQVGQAFQDLCSYGVPNETPPTHTHAAMGTQQKDPWCQREAKIATIHQRHAWNGFEIGYSMTETPSAELRRITKQGCKGVAVLNSTQYPLNSTQYPCRVPLHPQRREKSRLGGSLGRRDGVSSGGERAGRVSPGGERAAHAMGRDAFPSRDRMPGYVDMTWTQREDLNQKVERRLCKEQQVEKWQRKTLCGLQRTTELIHVFEKLRKISRDDI